MAFSDLLARADVSIRQTLGGTVTYAPGTGSPVDVKGVFDAAYVNADVGHAGVMSSGPAVFLVLSDLPSDPSDDTAATIIYSSVTYGIREAQPDGLGGVRLLLHQS